jgi:hypothetical protein
MLSEKQLHKGRFWSYLFSIPHCDNIIHIPAVTQQVQDLIKKRPRLGIR